MRLNIPVESTASTSSKSIRLSMCKAVITHCVEASSLATAFEFCTLGAHKVTLNLSHQHHQHHNHSILGPQQLQVQPKLQSSKAPDHSVTKAVPVTHLHHFTLFMLRDSRDSEGDRSLSCHLKKPKSPVLDQIMVSDLHVKMSNAKTQSFMASHGFMINGMKL